MFGLARGLPAGPEQLERNDQRSEFWARVGCLLPLACFWFTLTLPALLVTVGIPLVLLSNVRVSEQAMEMVLLASAPTVFLFCLWQVKRSLFGRKISIPKGYRELVGLVKGKDLPGLQNALGFLVEAISPQEAKTEQRWWNNLYAQFVSLMDTFVLGLAL